jgi:hypothetical protein
MYAFDHIRCYYWEFGPFQTYWRYMLMCFDTSTMDPALPATAAAAL